MLPVKIMLINFLGQSIITGANYPEGWVGRHLPIIKRKVQPLVLVCTGIACNRNGGMIGTLGCKLERGKEEVCEELRKMIIDVCCLQEVRRRGPGASMLG